MSLPTVAMRDLLQAGVHFGHRTRRWNPMMRPYLYGTHGGIHIINLQRTAPMLRRALQVIYEITSAGGRVLFVGTKRQARDPIAQAAKKCGQYYVNQRWLGGMLTNWKTVSHSIKRLNALDAQLEEPDLGLTKKEILQLTRERDKLLRALGGLRDMGGLPNVMVIIDTAHESIALAEANKSGIPVVGVVDSDCDPQDVLYPVPGNDDSIRSIELLCDLFSQAALRGLEADIAKRSQEPKQEANQVLSPDAANKAQDDKQEKTVATADEDQGKNQDKGQNKAPEKTAPTVEIKAKAPKATASSAAPVAPARTSPAQLSESTKASQTSQASEISGAPQAPQAPSPEEKTESS